jgi:hypothetical protein
MVIIFFAIGNFVSMVFILCVIFSALALARLRSRRRRRRQSSIRLRRMSAQRTGRVRIWTYLSRDHLSRPIRCLCFRLLLHIIECPLRYQQAALQLREQVLGSLHAGS